MCGIIGFFGKKGNDELAKKAMKILSHRGKDGQGIHSEKDYSIAHLLHSMEGNVKQPIIINNSILIANCEIYNWKDLEKKYSLTALNDAELMLKLINKIGLSKALEEFKGPYAACLIQKGNAYLLRDKLGQKPIWFCKSPFCFASEKKALEELGFDCVAELNPRNMIIYDIKSGKLKSKYLGFLKIEKKEIIEPAIEIKNALIESVKKMIPSKGKMGVLFSGGIDSTIIAYILKMLGKDFCCYCSGLKGSEDIEFAKKSANLHGFKLKIINFSEDDVKKDLPKICEIIESNNAVKAGVAIPFYCALKEAKKDGIKCIFSGLGSEEVFAGYKRFEGSSNIYDESIYGLKQLYERDLYRDDCLSMHFNIEMRLPFLDYDLMPLGLNLPDELKIKNDDKKIILTPSAKLLGIDKMIYERKKKAAQYGSKSDRVLEKLSKNFMGKSDYLKSIRNKPNLRLGCLYSGGKDSNLAMLIMKRQNYEISCLITILSKDDYSYMFQKANKKIIEMQSKALGIPAIFGNTLGEKEKELKDLKKLIEKARDEYCLDGIITGAIFSNYQRGRIFEICEQLNLKVFSPLWHKPQEQELRELLQNNFEFIIAKTAAMGLDEKWLGRVIGQKDLDELERLNKKIGINVAGEGGEYESIVLDSPMFNKKIKILKGQIIGQKDNYDYLIQKAKLIKK